MMIIPRRKNNYDLFDSMFEDPLFERHEAKFMKTDSYKTYTKAYDTFIKKNPGYEDKISEKIGS